MHGRDVARGRPHPARRLRPRRRRGRRRARAGARRAAAAEAVSRTLAVRRAARSRRRERRRGRRSRSSPQTAQRGPRTSRELATQRVAQRRAIAADSPGAGGRRQTRSPTASRRRPPTAVRRRRVRADAGRAAAGGGARSPSSPPATRSRAAPRPGLPVGWGVAAVDPSVIPLGTRIVGPRLRRRGRGRHRRRRHRLDRSTSGSRRPPRRYAWGRRTVTICPRTRLHLLADAARGGQAHRAIPRHAGDAPPRVLLVDDHDLFRTGLANLLEEQGVDVVGEATTGSEALRADPRARARRRRHGPEHAGDQRRRGDAPDRDDRAAHARARAHDLRPGRRRDGRDHGRRVRLPAEGLVDPGADRAGSAPPPSASR